MKKISSYILPFIRDKNKKNIFTIAVELIIQIIKFRALPIHYFTRFIYRKGVDPDDYTPNHIFDKIEGMLNDEQYYILFDDKYIFHKYIDNNLSVRQPNVYGYTKNGLFLNDKEILVVQRKSFIQLLSKLLKYNKIIIKPLKGRWGSGIVVLNKIEEITDDVINYLSENECILQEYVIQHDEISRIYPNSLNTLRIDTYYDLKNTRVLSA